MDYAWMVTVTLASADALTWGGGVRPWGIHGWSRLLWTICGWSYVLWAYINIWTFCPSKVLGNTKVTVSSMGNSGLSTAPSDSL